ncbi:MAG: RICIN domain-containing protein, partial [Aquabacterium sp.]|nr:RICIN domain-containing protein [Aquabacterium sp.]
MTLPPEPPPAPEGLKGVAVPEPSNLAQFVGDKAAAIRLGKALFWDTQVGSDGKTACASCHFHAGADNRTRNQVSPGLLRESSPGVPNPDFSFVLGGPNYRLKAEDFPFHKFADPSNRLSSVVRTHNDASSSQGMSRSTFVSAAAGAIADHFALAGDPVFRKDGLQTRQVEPRNSPTVINAVFNFRNFWDGRATYIFNGVSQFGAQDSGAKVYRTGATTATMAAQTVRLDNASLASLATGPVVDNIEMSAAGRGLPQVGLRLLPARALVQQAVSPTDSVLSGMRATTGLGLNSDYRTMVQAAFRPEWWNSTARVTLNGTSYTQQEANFSLYFGLALQLYMATLVADDTPFDRLMAGQPAGFNSDAAAGMGVFFGKGKCAECHGGAEFTNASVRKVTREPLARMVMGNGGTAVYDEGFYNIAITKTLDDISNGANNPLGKPNSLTRLAQQVGPAEFQRIVGIPANITVAAGERIAINGAFKTPTVRNVELTAPYFHDGSVLTLAQVVDFYNRGGNHFQNNLNDVDAEIKPLGLTPDERTQLVAFMKSLTDERVRFKRAPFDHPQLNDLPDGHTLDATGKTINDGGRARDNASALAAVGRGGLTVPPPNFMDQLESTTQYVSLKFAHSGKCLDVAGISQIDGANVYQWNCTGGANQQWIQIDTVGGFLLKARHSGKCLTVAGISQLSGANINQFTCIGGSNQIFNWVGNRLAAKHSGQCVHVIGAGQNDGANVVQAPCSTTDLNDQLAKASTPTNSVFNLVAAHSGKCVNVPGASLADGMPIDQFDCVKGAANELLEEVPAVGGFLLKARHSGKCLQVAGGQRTSRAPVVQWTCNTNDASQIMSWMGNRLQFKHSGQCLNVA